MHNDSMGIPAPTVHTLLDVLEDESISEINESYCLEYKNTIRSELKVLDLV